MTSPFALLYRLGVWCHRGAYEVGLRKKVRLPVPVLSVGNLTVGGNAKTPAVMALAQAAVGLHLKPVVLTRGYGGDGPPGEVTREHLQDPRSVRRFGDEPVLIKRRVPRAAVLVGSNRAASARNYLERHHADVFILDDGFQHWPLYRDFDLVLMDGEVPLGSGKSLPEGSLRESPRHLSRAAHILLVGGSKGEAVVREYAPQAQITLGRVRLDGVENTRGEAMNLQGKKVLLVSGIARPKRFMATVRALGAEVTGHEVYRDHHAFTGSEVKRAERIAERNQAILLTTEKDWVRLEQFAAPGWGVVKISLDSDVSWESLLQTCIKKGPA